MMKSKRGRMGFATPGATQTAFVIGQPLSSFGCKPSVLFCLLLKNALTITLIVSPVISPYLFYSLIRHPVLILTPVFQEIGAGDEIRTRDPQLGRLMLYQLSYTRPTEKGKGEG